VACEKRLGRYGGVLDAALDKPCAPNPSATQDLRVGGKNHGRVASELQPNPELRIESTPINFGYLTDHLSDQAVMHCSQLRPDRCHSLRGASQLNAWDVIGTTKRSPGNEPNPTTMAGLTLLLLRSVNGIGSRTTSFLEQHIEDIVSRVVPHPH